MDNYFLRELRRRGAGCAAGAGAAAGAVCAAGATVVLAVAVTGVGLLAAQHDWGWGVGFGLFELHIIFALKVCLLSHGPSFRTEPIGLHRGCQSGIEAAKCLPGRDFAGIGRSEQQFETGDLRKICKLPE